MNQTTRVYGWIPTPKQLGQLDLTEVQYKSRPQIRGKTDERSRSPISTWKREAPDLHFQLLPGNYETTTERA